MILIKKVKNRRNIYFFDKTKRFVWCEYRKWQNTDYLSDQNYDFRTD